MVKLGPILKFLGCQNNTWGVSALVVLVLQGSACSAVALQQLPSGIAHPAPPAIARFFLEQACQKVETLDRGITATMYEFPATTRRLIGARNFLTLEPDADNRLWANWWLEGESDPTTKVIHPVQSAQQVVEPHAGGGS